MMDKSGSDNIGLFGCIGSDAEIRNLGVGAVYDGVNGNNNVGVLGWLQRWHHQQLFCNGNATAGYDSAGGLVGSNGGTISDCYATGSATATGDSAGGLVGSNGGTISDCYATGECHCQ